MCLNCDLIVTQDNGASVGFAVAGGILLCLGNLGTQYALAYTNLSITEVVSSSLTVVGGTILCATPPSLRVLLFFARSPTLPLCH